MKSPLIYLIAALVFVNALSASAGPYRFECGGSGPWVEGLLGKWSTCGEVRRTYRSQRREFFAGRPDKTYTFWYDWHATVR